MAAITSTEQLIDYTINPTTDEAIAYWAGKAEPNDADLMLIEWHPEIYHTFRSNNREFDSSQYEF